MDPFTAITILAAHLLMSGGLLGLIAYRRPVHVELRDWSIGASCYGLAFAMRVFTGLGSTGLVPWLSDLLFIWGSLIIGRGMARLGLAQIRLVYVMGTFLLIAGFHAAVTAYFGLLGRFVSLNGILGTLYLAIYHISWNAPTSMPPNQSRLALPVRLFGFVLLLLAAASLGRTWHIYTHGTGALYQGWVAAGYFVVSSVLVTVLELVLLWIVFERMNSQLTEMNTRLADMAARDPLTRLLNRAGLTTAISEHFETKPGVPLVALLIDIDHFKSINDLYGHAAGDQVLCAVVTEGLLKVCRASDIVARVGGEEFAVLCGGQGQDDAVNLAERLRQHIGTLHVPVRAGDKPLQCTVSIGVSQPFRGAYAWDAANTEADRAMYSAKAAGRNCVHYADFDGRRSAIAQSFRPDPVPG